MSLRRVRKWLVFHGLSKHSRSQDGMFLGTIPYNPLLEHLICTALASHPCGSLPADAVDWTQRAYGVVCRSGGSWDRECCVDFRQLLAFLKAT